MSRPIFTVFILSASNNQVYNTKIFSLILKVYMVYTFIIKTLKILYIISIHM